METRDSLATMETTEAMLARLQARHRKRVQDAAAEEQRPAAKPKAAKRRSKASAETSAAPPTPKENETVLISQFLALGANTAPEPSSARFDSAVQPAPLRQQRQLMYRLVEELCKLSTHAWVVGDDDVRRKALIADALLLQNIPSPQRILSKRSISGLYSRICGALRLGHQHQRTHQDYTHASLTACYSWERKVMQFAETLNEMQQTCIDDYPCLWELRNRKRDAMLRHALFDMPRSSHELFQLLNNREAAASTPFGRLPAGVHIEQQYFKMPEYFVRMLACLELPDAQFWELPIPVHHTELIDKVVQHRTCAAEDSAAQPALIRASEITEILMAFSSDPYSDYAKKRWLWDVLKVPRKKREDPKYLPQIFESAVGDFLKELHINMHTGYPRSKNTLAVLALYHRILITWKKKNNGSMFCGPMCRPLANAEVPAETNIFLRSSVVKMPSW